MKQIKFFTAAVALAASLAFFALPVQAAPGVGFSSFGVTNATLAASTLYTAAQLGATTVVPLNYNNNCMLVFKGSVASTNASALSIILSRVDASGAVEPSTAQGGYLTWTFNVSGATAGTNLTFTAMTNLTSAYIGACSGLKLVSLTNGVAGNPDTITNPVVRVEIKNCIAPQ